MVSVRPENVDRSPGASPLGDLLLGPRHDDESLEASGFFDLSIITVVGQQAISTGGTEYFKVLTDSRRTPLGSVRSAVRSNSGLVPPTTSKLAAVLALSIRGPFQDCCEPIFRGGCELADIGSLVGDSTFEHRTMFGRYGLWLKPSAALADPAELCPLLFVSAVAVPALLWPSLAVLAVDVPPLFGTPTGGVLADGAAASALCTTVLTGLAVAVTRH